MYFATRSVNLGFVHCMDKSQSLDYILFTTIQRARIVEIQIHLAHAKLPSPTEAPRGQQRSIPPGHNRPIIIATSTEGSKQLSISKGDFR